MTLAALRSADRWDVSISLGLAFCGSIAVTCVLAATGGTRRLSVDLIAYAALAAAVSVRTRALPIPAVAVIAWLFYAGFLVGRHGEISWHGSIDVWRVAVIVGAAYCGAMIGRVLRYV
jgi:hypothetical protein